MCTVYATTKQQQKYRCNIVYWDFLFGSRETVIYSVARILLKTGRSNIKQSFEIEGWWLRYGGYLNRLPIASKQYQLIQHRYFCQIQITEQIILFFCFYFYSHCHTFFRYIFPSGVLHWRRDTILSSLPSKTNYILTTRIVHSVEMQTHAEFRYCESISPRHSAHIWALALYWLWSPYGIERTIIFSCCGLF